MSQTVLTNVLVVDDQHRVFFDLLSRLEEAMKGGQGAAQIPALTHELLRLAEFHFATEERLMESYGYPLRDMHRMEHQMARERLRNPSRDLTAVTALDGLMAWLDDHIAKWDVQLGQYLNDRGVK